MRSIQGLRTDDVRSRALALVLVPMLAAGTLAAQGPLGSQQRTQKISSLEGGFAGPLANLDFFGTSSATIGDLDGDGNDDLAVGSRDSVPAAAKVGAVWILLMNADGTVKSETKLSTAAGTVTGGPANGFGRAITALGDLDGDDVPDIGVGDPLASDGGVLRGAVRILLLNADGSLKTELSISSTSGGFTGPLANGDRFGSSLAMLDPSAPGAVCDLAVGATGDDDGGFDRGAVWILSLASNGSVLAEKKISQTSGGFGGALSDEDAFGNAVAALGDVDCDGLRDLAVGAERDDDGNVDAGAVWVLFRNAAGTVKGQRKIGSLSGDPVGPLDALDNFGSGIATLGDLDVDGIPDMAVGAPGDDDGGPRRGAVWLLFLNKDGSVRSTLKLSDADPGFAGILFNGDTFGTSLGFITDLDGNGLPEITVGTPGDDDGGNSRGAVYVIFFQFPAAMVSNGSGINPVALQSGTTPPQIGSVWDPIIDPSALPLVGGANFHVIGISSQPLPQGVMNLGANVMGELLISLAAGDLQLTQSVAPGENFSISIPSNVALIGLDCFSQGLVLDDTTITLTNRLDAVIGFPPSGTSTAASPAALPVAGQPALGRAQ